LIISLPPSPVPGFVPEAPQLKDIFPADVATFFEYRFGLVMIDAERQFRNNTLSHEK